MLSNYDIKFIRRDPLIPGLNLLFDTDLLMDELTSDITEFSGAECDIKYIRYKPGMNCLVCYVITEGGKDYTAYAKAHNAGNGDVKLNKSRMRRAVPVIGSKGRKLIDRLYAEICFFPNDNKLKHIKKIFHKEHSHKLLEELLPDNSDFWDADFNVIAYKPERRLVLKLINDAKKNIVVKFYTKTDYEKALTNSRLFCSKGNMIIPEILGHSQRYNAIAFDWLEGELLNNKLVSYDIDTNILKEVGTAISNLHYQSTKCRESYVLDSLTPDMFPLYDTFAIICPEYKSRLDKIYLCLRKLISELEVTKKIIHGDFYAKQVLIAKNGIGILDFDRAVLCDPAYDIGLFLAHLYRGLIKNNLSQDLIDFSKENLLSGYRCEKINRDFVGRVDIYTVYGILSLVPHFFRDHLANWYGDTDLLISYAENLLSKIQNHRNSHFVPQGNLSFFSISN